MTTPIRAALYLRVSTSRQADNGLSLFAVDQTSFATRVP